MPNPLLAANAPTTVTYVSMIAAGLPSGSIYGVYRGRLRYRKGVPHSIDLNRSLHVASTTVPTGERADYLALAKRYETPEYPAFNWGRP